MNGDERSAAGDLRINVLRADEVGAWHCILKLALELERPGAPLRSSHLGCLDYVAADGQRRAFTPELMANVFELPAHLVTSTVEKLLELRILVRDGATLRIENPAGWFVSLAEHPPLRN